MPVPSVDCRDGPVLHHRRDRVTLAYDFPSANREFVWESLLFLGVAAIEFTPHGACNREQLAASDRLVEVEGSAWRHPVKDGVANGATLRHYRIAFEMFGCYDLLALDYVPPPAGPPRPLSPTVAAQSG